MDLDTTNLAKNIHAMTIVLERGDSICFHLHQDFFPPEHQYAFETLNVFDYSDFKTVKKIEYLMSRNNNSARPTRSTCKRAAHLHVRISFRTASLLLAN